MMAKVADVTYAGRCIKPVPNSVGTSTQRTMIYATNVLHVKNALPTNMTW